MACHLLIKDMRLIILFLFLCLTASGQVSDATLTTQNNTTIFGNTPRPVPLGNMFQSIIDSKANISKLKYSGVSPTTITVGGLPSGSIIADSSLVYIIQSILAPYVNPVFTSFSISGQSTTVEVGTTLSGSKTFTWNINQNSGVVSTIDLYNVSTSSTLLAGTANDGSQAQTITTVQLNSNGATQVWRGIGNNSSPSGTFNSSNFTVTGRYYRFFGPTASSPSNSAAVRALTYSVFHTGASVFNLETGTTETKFVVALPPGVTISNVVDLDALNANITSEYVLTGTVNVLDAGSTNRSYNIYEMNIGAAYSTNHTHQITTAN